MKPALGALDSIRGYFNRDGFQKRFEHEVDSADYTSVYPCITLALNQRFVSKCFYIAKLPKEGQGGLIAVAVWLIIPGSKYRREPDVSKQALVGART